MLKVVKKDETQLLDFIRRNQGKNADKIERAGFNPKDILTNELGWLMSLVKFEGAPIEFDGYQVAMLTNQSSSQSMLKSRQVGFSLAIACKCLARSHIMPKHSSVCVSYRLDDAKLKIATAKELHEDLPLEFKKKIVIDTKTEVGFVSNGKEKKVSRILSYPSKAPRGQTGDVYLDELAHCVNDKSIYKGATALIARSGGQLVIGSTPLGKRGTFYEVHTEAIEKYNGFWRQAVPWWLCRHFCLDVASAANLAPTMSTIERVSTFATKSISEQYDSLPEEDFQQEYELSFQDEKVSFFPFELIVPCMTRDAHVLPVFEDIGLLLVKASDLGQLCLGFDVGRVNHPSELYIFSEKDGKFTERYHQQFKNVSFPIQRETLRNICRRLKSFIKVIRIDATGLGMNLAEDLGEDYEFGHLVDPVMFTLKSKAHLANNLKILFQERNIELAKDRDTITQIHSVKQKLSTYGNVIFDAERSTKHHADKAWAIALACLRPRQIRAPEPIDVGVRLIGQSKKSPESKSTEPLPNPFDVPEPPPVRPENMAVIVVTEETLIAKAKSLRVALRIWKESGDIERSKEIHIQYVRIKNEIIRRRQARLEELRGRNIDLKRNKSLTSTQDSV